VKDPPPRPFLSGMPRSSASPASPHDDEENVILELLTRACEGDDEAWQAVWTWIDPRLSALVSQPRFLARISQHEDDRRGVILSVMERLREDGFRRLKLFQKARALDGRLPFMAWLAVVTKRVAIDYLRAHPDYVDLRRRPGSEAPGAWVDVQALPSEWRVPGVRPPVTARGTAAELLAFARRELPAQQQRALELWTQGESSSEIARAMGLSTSEAERLVRAAVERLRRKFRTAGGLV